MIEMTDMKEYVGSEGNETEIEDRGNGIFSINTGTGLMEVTLLITLEDLKYIFCQSRKLLQDNKVKIPCIEKTCTFEESDDCTLWGD
jgi:hypothetical protein